MLTNTLSLQSLTERACRSGSTWEAANAPRQARAPHPPAGGRENARRVSRWCLMQASVVRNVGGVENFWVLEFLDGRWRDGARGREGPALARFLARGGGWSAATVFADRR